MLLHLPLVCTYCGGLPEYQDIGGEEVGVVIGCMRARESGEKNMLCMLNICNYTVVCMYVQCNAYDLGDRG